MRSTSVSVTSTAVWSLAAVAVVWGIVSPTYMWAQEPTASESNGQNGSLQVRDAAEDDQSAKTAPKDQPLDTSTISATDSADEISVPNILVTPKLRVEGPEYQSCYAFIRYYDQGALSKSVQSRLTVEGGVAELDLEFGHAGLRIRLVSPTTRPITAKLMDGDEVIDTQQTRQRGAEIEIEHGDLGNQEAQAIASVLPSEDHYRFVSSVLTAMRRGSTQALVSPSRQVNVQWQTLDAFANALRTELGEPKDLSSDMDGWLTWKGNLGSRVHAGPVEFQRGVCHLMLIEIDGLLVDVQARSDGVPEDWFQGPSSSAAYVEKANQLARLIFARQDQSEAAQRLFTRRLHETITVEKLQEFRSQMQAEFGNSIRNVDLLDTKMEPYRPDQVVRTFDVLLRLEMEEAEDCICITRFEFNSGFPSDSQTADSHQRPDAYFRVGLGQLVGVNIRPSWPSAAPAQAAVASKLLSQLRSGNLDLTLWHPMAARAMDPTSLEDAGRTIRKRFGMLGDTELETWAGDEAESIGWARGDVATDQGRVQLKIDFIDDKILGFGLAGRDANFESHSLVRDAAELGYRGDNFWTRLLKGDLPDAHRALAEEFQTQLPLTRFEKLVESSGLADGRKLKQVVCDQTRFADRLDRKLPLIISTYHNAEFRNGDTHALRCEFRWANDQWELIDFTSDFAKVFPTEKLEDKFVQLAKGLQTKDAEAIIELLSPQHAELAYEPILAAFLTVLHEELGEVDFEDAVSTQRYVRQIAHYERGSKQVTCTAKLRTSSQTHRLVATFLNHHLLAFAVDAPNLNRTINQLDDPNWFAEHAVALMSDWTFEDGRMFTNHLVDELRVEEVQTQWMTWKSGWQLTMGKLQTIDCSSTRFASNANEVVCELELSFEEGTIKVMITFVVDAFTARIVELRPIADVAN